MWWEYFLFELKFRFRQPLFWIISLILLLAGILLVSTDLAVLITTEKKLIFRNAPYVLINIQIIMSALGLFALTAFVADSVLRDFHLNTHMFFFSKPTKKLDYFIGRFLGSTLMSVALFLFLLIGIMIAAHVPWQDPSRIGPYQWGPLFYGFIVMVLPTLLALGALLFAVAVLSKRLLVIYLFVLAMVIAQDVAEIIARGLDNLLLGGLIEPFGLVALDEITRYWTIAEFNTKLPTLSTGLLLNRLVWLALGLASLIFAYFRFNPSGSPPKRKPKKRITKKINPRPEAILPNVLRDFSLPATWRRMFWQVRLETLIVLKSVPFLVFVITGVLLSVFLASVVGSFNGIPSIPLSSLMLTALNIPIKVILPIIIIIYTGELIWRDPQTATIEDVLPLPNWVFMSSKLLTLSVVILITIGSGILTMILYQLSQGFTQLELLGYLKGFLFLAYPMLLLAVAAIFLHTIANSKFVGHLFVLLLLVSALVLPKMGFENVLFQYSKFPTLIYSDFNGYGHYLHSYFAYAIYWGLAALILFALTSLIWARGADPELGARLKLAHRRFNIKTALTLGGLLTVFLVCMLYIQSHDSSLSQEQRRLQLAQYEMQYARYASLPLPHIRAVKVEVDIFPYQRRAAIKGSYTVINQGDEAISVLPITMSPRFLEGISPVESGVSLVSLGDLKAKLADKELGFYLYQLPQPLLPDAVMTVDFVVEVDQSGFRKLPVDQQIVANGSHLLSRGFFPTFGYSYDNQLLDPHQRAALSLPVINRAASADNTAALESNYLNADWVEYEAILSTTADQIAITAGKLERQWESSGRRYFHYKTQAPITNLQAIVSASFEVKRAIHNGVQIEIYYLPQHAFNIDRMMELTIATMEYATEKFSPYPHHVLRIVEVPNYGGPVAISLGGMITISESMGFNSHDQGIDPVKFVTVHEVAHQWWNHQVVSANVQGASMIGETLSEYTTLLVLEKEFGKQATLQWLEYKADAYLKGRQTEIRAEMPLVQVENQGYIHYHKGLIVFNALRDLLGEDQLNTILREYLSKFRFQGPPYSSAQDLVKQFRDTLPAEQHHLLADLFEAVMIYDNRLLDTSLSTHADGRYRLDLSFSSRKLRLDQSGDETEITPSGNIQIGLFSKDDYLPFQLESHAITGTLTRISIWTDKYPSRVGLDPMLTMIDRDRKDNYSNLHPSEGSTNAAN